MRERLEEEPEPDQPEPEEPSGAATTTLIPSVPDGSREFEYRLEVVSDAQVLDGTTLPEQLTKASADGWDLVDIVGAGERHAVLLRRAKRSEKAPRPVGFTPPR